MTSTWLLYKRTTRNTGGFGSHLVLIPSSLGSEKLLASLVLNAGTVANIVGILIVEVELLLGILLLSASVKGG
ncbi:hypothetical protein JAAARDRAFT_32275 [Jaapia argillacea MUCL 33604]|uniref:Uncharacterized protein n=1 Tax=Jaapia argillacea MUCL 33604 TaxID=933084 RepID=A0A067QCP0_9AGAM|nr:hypothetical protein JAAARDRAFT_32275 [Jaapia argillacea MUCL 33604]